MIKDLLRQFLKGTCIILMMPTVGLAIYGSCWALGKMFGRSPEFIGVIVLLSTVFITLAIAAGATWENKQKEDGDL